MSLRSDNGREYRNADFEHLLKSEGIKHQTSVPYTPQQNGVAERANRTLVEMARCMITESSSPEFLWSEAISAATYLRNRCCTKVLNNKTPFEAWHGRKPAHSELKS